MQTLKKLIAIASVALAPMAQAASGQSFLDLSQMTFTFVGLTGSFTGTGDLRSSNVYIDGLSASDNSALLDGPAYASLTTASASVSALGNATSLTAVASSTGGNASGGAGAYAGGVTLNGTGYLIITVPYTLAVDVSQANDQSAQGNVRMDLRGGTFMDGVFSSENYSAEQNLYSLQYPGFVGGASSRSGLLTLFYYQSAPTSKHFSFNTSVFATAAGTLTAAVPEPETYAMLLAGLGLMGVVARRRRNAA